MFHNNPFKPCKALVLLSALSVHFMFPSILSIRFLILDFLSSFIATVVSKIPRKIIINKERNYFC